VGARARLGSRGGDLTDWSAVDHRGLAAQLCGTGRLKEHARQSREMEFLYSRASEHLSAALGAKDFRQGAAHCFELGREALEENAEWLILHRERPLSVPE